MKKRTISFALLSVVFLCLSRKKAEAQTISIGDKVWYDENRNGRQDSGEPGVSNITVKLFADANGDNIADNATPVATAVTNANGNYTFSAAAGKYFVQFPIPVPSGYSGYTTQGASGVPASQWSSCNITTGKTGTHHFTANYLMKDAGLLKNIGISGTVYDDNNAGTPDGTVFPNVNVTLKKDGVSVATAVTDAQGKYSFSNLIPGDYSVILTLGGGYQGVSATDASPADGSTNVTLGSTSSATGINFGLNLKPTATNDNLNNQTPGTAALVPNILANDSDPNNGIVSKDSISLVAPSGATGITTDAQGDVIGFTVPGQGTWSLNSSTGAVTFTPQNGFTADPTPIKYTVTDNARLNSGEATITIDYNPPVTLSGIVYDDNNAGTPDGTVFPGVNVTLKRNGLSVATAVTDAQGKYSFDNLVPGDYSVILTLGGGYQGVSATDATPADGVTNVTVGSSNISGINFGLNLKPTATNDNLNNQTPGTAATVANILSNDTDPNSGTLSKDSISLVAPSGATGITTDAQGDVIGFTVPNQGTWALNSTNGIVSFTPQGGFYADPTPIKYTVTDNAGLTSNEATITIDYNPLAVLSGTIYDDNNAGTPDGTVLAGTTVSLFNNGFSTTTTTNVSGNYSFSDIVPNWYYVSVGAPSGYQHVSSTDASPADGAVLLYIGNNNITGINFGVNKAPVATNDNLANQTPGTAATVANILSNDTDPNSGTLSKDSISLVAPSGATGITTDAQGDVTGFIVPNQGVWALNSSTAAVTFTPQSGFYAAPTPIKYTVTDNAKLTSNEATITIDYNPLPTVSGTVYNDNNGGTINGTGTNAAGTLHALLVNNSGNVSSSVPVSASGQYTFPGVAPGNYTIRLSTTAGTAGQAAPAASLPAGWANTAEGLAAAGDGATDGSISLVMSTTAVTNANFGIQALPQPKNLTATTQFNPGGTLSLIVPATTFGGTDVDNGNIASLRITTFPVGAATISVNGVTYTTAGFPGTTGISVPTDTLGRPAQTIAVDPAQDGATTVIISYKVTDNAGMESTTSGTATLPLIRNTTQAVNDINNTLINTAVTGNVLTNDEDYEGNTQTVNPNTVSPPAHGTVNLSTNGTYTYTPASNYVGEDQFRYRVCDNGNPSACDTAVVTIKILPLLVAGNNPPVANDDASSTPVNTPVSGNLLANDKDPDANPLTVNTTPVSAPVHGAVTITGNGTYTYTPVNGYVGKDSFDYRVCDNGTPALCAVATVIIDVLPAITANITYANDDAGIGKQNTPINGNVKTNDTDPEGHTQTVTTTPVVLPAHGSVLLNSDGTYTYTPNTGYTGPDKFVYTTCDNGNPVACDQATVYLTVMAPPDPDLTPVILLPVNAMNPGDSRDFVVRLNEIRNVATGSQIAFNISVPVGYTLTFNGTANSINVLPSGTYTVSNSQWNTFNATNRSLDLQSKTGFVISGKGNSYIGFKVTRTSALSNSVANISVNIYPDNARRYDSNNANNLYHRVITAN